MTKLIFQWNRRSQSLSQHRRRTKQHQTSERCIHLLFQSDVEWPRGRTCHCNHHHHHSPLFCCVRPCPPPAPAATIKIKFTWGHKGPTCVQSTRTHSYMYYNYYTKLRWVIYFSGNLLARPNVFHGFKKLVCMCNKTFEHEKLWCVGKIEMSNVSIKILDLARPPIKSPKPSLKRAYHHGTK